MNADIDLEEVMQNVSKDFEDSLGDIDTAYQTEGWYKAAVAVTRTVNLLLCAVLVIAFAGGI